jgi:hypothetical protein
VGLRNQRLTGLILSTKGNFTFTCPAERRDFVISALVSEEVSTSYQVVILFNKKTADPSAVLGADPGG